MRMDKVYAQWCKSCVNSSCRNPYSFCSRIRAPFRNGWNTSQRIRHFRSSATKYRKKTGTNKFQLSPGFFISARSNGMCKKFSKNIIKFHKISLIFMKLSNSIKFHLNTYAMKSLNSLQIR